MSKHTLNTMDSQQQQQPVQVTPSPPSQVCRWLNKLFILSPPSLCHHSDSPCFWDQITISRVFVKAVLWNHFSVDAEAARGTDGSDKIFHQLFFIEFHKLTRVQLFIDFITKHRNWLKYIFNFLASRQFCCIVFNCPIPIIFCVVDFFVCCQFIDQTHHQAFRCVKNLFLLSLKSLSKRKLLLPCFCKLYNSIWINKTSSWWTFVFDVFYTSWFYWLLLCCDGLDTEN